MCKLENSTQIDIMCLTMINPAISWFKMCQLQVIEVENCTIKKVKKKTYLTRLKLK